MTFAEFFEFVVNESKKLEIEVKAYQTVFDGVKRITAKHPEYAALLRTLCLDADGLDGLLAGAKSIPSLHAKTHSKYDLILEMLHPQGAVAPTLTEIESKLEGIKQWDWN